MKQTFNGFLLVAILIACGCWVSAKYDPTWESLKEYNEAPEWFMDAKLGIYFHWGVYSVPAYGSEWYPRNMHLEKDSVYKHHVETYGDPSKFGYHDFVPMFKAEHFNADEWAELFKDAGARFAGPVAEHHDGFSMWDSKVNPWNAKDKGPKRDIVGEMEKAVRKQDMRFITSFHHAFNSQHAIQGYPTGYYTPKEGWPTASDDPELRLMYGHMPREEFLDRWKAKLAEVIDGYHPDIIWFDFVLGDIAEKTRQEFLAYYFNRANQWDKEVVVTYKGEDLPREVGIEDFEKGRLDHLTDYPWLTDDTISWGSWCYTEGLQVKSTQTVLHTLIDIVSKNGCLLLNISPKADGTIPENQKTVLLEMGDWLKVNGEAIYETRPWKIYGQGPTEMGKSGHFVGRIDYTGQDIRFTRSKDGKTVYAICLGWPEGQLVLDAVCVNTVGPDAKIQLLGSDEKVAYSLGSEGSLVIQPPQLSADKRPCQHAYVFKIEGFDLGSNLFALPDAVALTAEKAVLSGQQISLEESQKGRKNIGMWNNASESIHWLARIPKAGTYQLRGEFASAQGNVSLKIETDGQSVSFEVPGTANWSDGKMVKIGTMHFKKTGIYHVVLLTKKEESHKPVNVWQIQFAADSF